MVSSPRAALICGSVGDAAAPELVKVIESNGSYATA